MIRAIRSLWAEVMIPSGHESGYLWSVIGLGHVMLGAAFAWCWWIAAPVYLIKEAFDIRNGGRWRDSVVDAGLVGVGLFYAGPWYWPVMVLVAIVIGAIVRQQQAASYYDKTLDGVEVVGAVDWPEGNDNAD